MDVVKLLLGTHVDVVFDRFAIQVFGFVRTHQTPVRIPKQPIGGSIFILKMVRMGFSHPNAAGKIGWDARKRTRLTVEAAIVGFDFPLPNPFAVGGKSNDPAIAPIPKQRNRFGCAIGCGEGRRCRDFVVGVGIVAGGGERSLEYSQGRHLHLTSGIDGNRHLVAASLLAIISTQLQHVGSRLGKLNGGIGLAGIFKGRVSRTGHLLPLESEVGIGWAIVACRTVELNGFRNRYGLRRSGTHDRRAIDWRFRCCILGWGGLAATDSEGASGDRQRESFRSKCRRPEGFHSRKVCCALGIRTMGNLP